MSDIRINETVENEIIDLFEKNIVNPVLEKVATEEHINNAKAEIESKETEIQNSLKSFDTLINKKADDFDLALGQKEKTVIGEISTVKDKVNNQNNAIKELTEHIDEAIREIMERIDSYRDYNQKANRIKYGLIGAIGVIMTALEILALVLR